MRVSRLLIALFALLGCLGWADNPYEAPSCRQNTLHAGAESVARYLAEMMVDGEGQSLVESRSFRLGGRVWKVQYFYPGYGGPGRKKVDEVLKVLGRRTLRVADTGFDLMPVVATTTGLTALVAVGGAVFHAAEILSWAMFGHSYWELVQGMPIVSAAAFTALVGTAVLTFEAIKDEDPAVLHARSLRKLLDGLSEPTLRLGIYDQNQIERLNWFFASGER